MEQTKNYLEIQTANGILRSRVFTSRELITQLHVRLRLRAGVFGLLATRRNPRVAPTISFLSSRSLGRKANPSTRHDSATKKPCANQRSGEHHASFAGIFL